MTQSSTEEGIKKDKKDEQFQTSSERERVSFKSFWLEIPEVFLRSEEVFDAFK